MPELVFNPGNLKAAMGAAGATKRDIWYVPVDMLMIREGFNIREKDDAYHAHVRWIADSIKANGFYPDEPLGVVVDGDTIIVHAGHCRLEAAFIAISEGAPLTELPCVPAPRGTSTEDLTVALHTTNAGKPLTPYELAVLCKRLTAFNWDEKQIAARLAFTPTYVHQLLSIMEAPADVRDAVRLGEMSLSLALSVVQKHGKEAPAVVKKAVSKAKAGGKKKATAKHLDNTKLFASLKRLSQPMYQALEAVRSDGKFNSLSSNVRDQVLGILDSIDTKG